MERGECPTLAEFAPEWLVTYAVVNNKPAERIRKEHLLRNHLGPFFGNRRLDEITTVRIEAYKAQKIRSGLKASTINRHLATLGSLLRCAIDWDRLANMPKIKYLPQPPAEFDWLRPEEAGRLLEAARSRNTKYYTVFLLALRTGLRKGEIMALHWRNVDLAERRLAVKHTAFRGRLVPPKDGRTRIVPMTADLCAALSAWRRVSTGEVVFPSRAGNVSASPGLYGKALNRCLKWADLRHVRFHDLRHSFASHLVLKRCSLREVQLLLGHYSIKMTERYAHIGEDRLAQAIEVLDGLGIDPTDDSAGET